MADPRYYRQSDYDRYDDSATRRDDYERDSPYNTLYRRSFDAVPDDTRSTRSARSGNEGRSKRHHHHRDSYDDDADRFQDEQNMKQRQLDRRQDQYQDAYGVQRSQAQANGDGYDDYGGQSQRSRRSRHKSDGEGEDNERLGGVVGKETKDIMATVVGALGGAFLGHEASHGKGFGTLGGAVLGGLSANAVEHRHLKREEEREEQARNQ